jgi:FAD/FMN-containing dehydrogenase
VADRRLNLIADLGDDLVLTNPASIERFETGYRYGRGRALAVVLPRTVKDVSRVVASCVRLGIGLVAQGANTGLVGASVPDESGEQVVIALERLRSFEIDPRSRVAVAQAGVDLATLNAAAAAHGLMFPLDLAANPSVGGMVSTNAGGSRVLKYGDVRRNVLGLEAVLPDADGTVVDAMSALRKSSLGLDVKQLFIGTGGSFGIITAATLALHPLPGSTAAALVVPTSLSTVIDLLQFLGDQLGDRLSAFEGMSRGAMSAALEHVPSLRNPFAGEALPGYAILVEASGAPDEVSSLEPRLADTVEGAFSRGLITDARFGAPEPLWRLRHALSEGLRHEGQVLGFDISLPLGALAAFHEDLEADVLPRFPNFRCCDFGHWGDGGEHLNFVYSASAAHPASVSALRDQVYDLVARHRGAFSAEHGLGPHNRAYYDRHVPHAWRRLAGAINKAVDPAALLGRVEYAVQANGGDA